MVNVNNYLNLVGYIINAFVTAFASSIFGFPDNAELSEKYQTLVTPSGFTFAIWGVIFLSQLIFTVAQMFSKYSSEQSVQIFDYWYFVACIFQSAWTFTFGYEIIWLSVVCMGGILVSLYQIVNLQNGLDTDAATFWLFQFPFSIHCGWIAAAFGVNFNVWPVSAGVQNIAIPYVTLIYAVGVAIYALFGFGGPDYTIPCVLMWALFGITAELKNPKDSIVRSFSEGQIASFRHVCTWLIVLLVVATAAIGGYKIFKKRNTEQGDYQRI